MYNEVQKKKAAARAKKCLQNKYKHASVNVRNEMYEDWQAYAASKGLSFRAMVIEAIEKAMEADGFKPLSENVEEK